MRTLVVLPDGTGDDSVTVTVTVLVPLLPSVIEASLTRTDRCWGAASHSVGVIPSVNARMLPVSAAAKSCACSVQVPAIGLPSRPAQRHVRLEAAGVRRAAGGLDAAAGAFVVEQRLAQIVAAAAGGRDHRHLRAIGGEQANLQITEIAVIETDRRRADRRAAHAAVDAQIDIADDAGQRRDVQRCIGVGARARVAAVRDRDDRAAVAEGPPGAGATGAASHRELLRTVVAGVAQGQRQRQRRAAGIAGAEAEAQLAGVGRVPRGRDWPAGPADR